MEEQLVVWWPLDKCCSERRSCGEQQRLGKHREEGLVACVI